MNTDGTQKDIIAEMQRLASDKRDKRFIHGIAILFPVLVVCILGGVYWAVELRQPPELIIIAAPENVKIVPEQAEPQEALRILSLNDPEASTEAAMQDADIQIVAPESELVPELLSVPENDNALPENMDDQARLERLQQKILAGLTEQEVTPEETPDTEALKAEIVEGLKP